FRSAAVRKVDTESSEVKAPFFTEIEVLAGKTVKLFVIPVTTGSFEMLCELPGHREAGMEGTVTVTGTKPATPVEELGTLATGQWVQNGPALVEAASKTWDATAVKAQFEAGEQAPDATGKTMFFKPANIDLKLNTPAVITLVNVGKTKHEWSSETFFPTMALRKAEDAFGEYKAMVLDEAEVKPGGKLELFVIPTKAGTFNIDCAIPGHKAAGMFGTVTVK
ncbi:MAG: plastocyanin/azurin family copper-binding protein, partial [Chloroflexota bacterium]|nr:plastocyanin/azurin family copper-binding protein [Chloroflexota bacterium]